MLVRRMLRKRNKDIMFFLSWHNANQKKKLIIIHQYFLLINQYEKQFYIIL